MTRDFNKQPRNDARPSFRRPSSGRDGEERASRPARPRLNREIVDRAWESGAPQNHADYRSRRNTNNGQAPLNGRRNYRDGQKPDYSSQQGRPENRPYGNRSNNYQQREYDRPSSYQNRGNDRPNSYQNRDNDRYGRRSDEPYQDRRPRSFDSDRRPSQNSRFGDRRGYSDGPNDKNGAFGPNNVRPYQNYRDTPSSQGPNRRNQDRNFDGPRRPFERDSRGPNRYGGNRDRDERPARGGYQDRQQRPYRPYNQEQPARRRYDDALFEGDYEGVGQEQTRATRSEHPERSERPSRDTFRRNDKPDTAERQVTRLPDGRVLKGPRPVQRKNAAFWNEIAEDTDDLLDQVQVPASSSTEEQEADIVTDELALVETSEEVATGTEGKAARKPRTRVASAIARSKKAATAKPRSTGPRPSQRGFKWPSES